MNGGSQILKYIITSNIDLSINVESINTFCIMSNLTNNLSYIFSVNSVNIKGMSIDISNNTIDTTLTNLGLSYFYKFAENDIVNNKVKNYATNQYDATVYNSGIIQTTTFIVNNSSLYLNGNSQYIQLDTFNITNNGLTIASWFNFSPGRFWSRLFDFGYNQAGDNIVFSPENGCSLYINTVESVSRFVATVYADNTWHHIAWTFNPNGQRIIYIDGNIVDSSAVGYPTVNVNRNQSYLGKSNWNADPYTNGYISNFMVFNSILSQADVIKIKNYTVSILNKSNSVTPSNIYSNNPTVSSYSAGPSPFISNVVISNIDIINLTSIRFEIQPKTGSVTVPISSSYDYGYLNTNNLINYTNRTVTICVFGLYASNNITTNTVTFYFNINSVISNLVTTITTSIWQGLNYGTYSNPTKLNTRDNSVYLGFSYFLLKEFQDSIGPVLIDTDGEVRWVNTSGANSQSSIFYGNTIFTGAGTSLYRTQLNGSYTLLKDYSSVQISGSNINTITHHNIDFGKNGMLICTSTNAYTEASVIEVDYNGNLLRTFDIANTLLIWMQNNGDGVNAVTFVDSTKDWFHNNANCYWSEFNELILSGREDFVIAIDYDNPSTIKWILGDTTKAWYQNFVSLRQFSLTLIGSTLPPIGQHAVSITFDSNLLLFDDGYQSFNHTPVGGSRNYAAGRMYHINRTTMTANEIYTFDDNQQISSQICSSIYQTHDSQGETYLINFANAGGGPRIFGLGVQNSITKNIPIAFQYQYSNSITAGWNAIQIKLNDINFTNTIIPQPPTNVVATTILSSIYVSWTASNSADSYIIISSDNKSLVTTNTNITFNDLIQGSTYTFSVIAVNIIGNSNKSIPSNLINLLINNDNNYRLLNDITFSDIYPKYIYAISATKEYNNNILAYLTFSGLINYGTIYYNAFYNDKNAGNNKLINITDFSGNGNYVLENFETYGNIIPKPININFNINKFYDRTQYITNYSYEFIGKYQTDDLSNSIYGLYRDYNANLNIIVDISNIILYGTDSKNYTIQKYLTISGNIYPLELKINPLSKIYDKTTKANVIFSNLISPDTINYNSSFNDSTIGNDKIINIQLINSNQPLLINNLQLWLDAADYSTLTFSNNILQQWNDKSTNLRNASTYGGSSITYNISELGLVFNTSGLVASIPSGTFNNGMTVFAVFKTNQNNAIYQTPFNRTTGNIGNPLDIYDTSRWINGNISFSSPFNIMTDATTLTIFNVVISNQEYREYVNNNFILTHAINALADNENNFYIGIRADSATKLSGIIYEIIVYNRTLSDNERLEIYNYLDIKWKTKTLIQLNNYLLGTYYGNILHIPVQFYGLPKIYDQTTTVYLTLSSDILLDFSNNNITYNYNANYISPYVGYNQINVTANLIGNDISYYKVENIAYGNILPKFILFYPVFIKQYDGSTIAYLESYTVSGAFLSDISFIDISYNATYELFYPANNIMVNCYFSFAGQLGYNYTTTIFINDGLTLYTANSSGVILYTEFPNSGNGNYYIKPINGTVDLFYIRMDIDNGGWMLIYEWNTGRQNNSIPYSVNKSSSLGTTQIKRVAYYMQNNGVWAWVSFNYQSSGMTHYDIPTGGSSNNVFTNSNNIYNMNVISNSPNITNATNIPGYIQTWPDNYSGSPLGGYNLYNTGYGTGIGYGAFNLWNLNTLDCIFAWNDQGSSNPCTGFGNGPSSKDWTFANVQPINFKFQIFVQI
jgi:hypothetical protein